MRAPQVLAKIRLFSGTAPFPRMPFIPVYPANTGTYQSTAKFKPPTPSLFA
jgi:hypothetical protein